MKPIVSGASKGLGRTLVDFLDGIPLTRSNGEELLAELAVEAPEIVIHCASTPSRDPVDTQSFQFWDDNLFLTQRLLRTRPKKFIFISSVDVLPLLKGKPGSAYAMTKLANECLVREFGNQALILRPSALLGLTMRQNSFFKLLENKPCALSLSGESTLNYVLHSDVARLVDLAIKRNWTGTHSIASTSPISLRETAGLLGTTRVHFGEHRYKTEGIDVESLVEFMPEMKKTSRQVIEEFLEEKRRNHHENHIVHAHTQ